MKCPDCGCEIAEGYLYCEKCGKEIQIVPDFEPEIENSIIETLSTVAEEIEGSGSAKPQNEVQEKSELTKSEKKKSEDNFFREIPRKNWLFASLATFIAVALIGVFAAIFVYHKYSFNYQVEQAKKYAAQKNYEEAIKYFEAARKLDSKAVDIVLLEASYYYQLGESDKSLGLLLELIDKGQLEYEEKEKAFEVIVVIYDEQGKYKEINALLSSCEDDGIKNHFQQYMALVPEFGYASGTYEEVVPLKLSANTMGKIYYTMDGSDPDESSEVYTAPLFLESGEYQISALFINEYGIRSKIARGWYVINLTVPEAPEVLLYSGDYHEPTLLEVNVPEGGTVYYTTDGTKPNEDSLKYTEPISIPLGRSNFKFVTISPEGVSSEEVSRSFDFTLKTDVTLDKAIRSVVQALFDWKVLTDMQGHSHEIQGKYVFKYDTIVEIPNLGYYYLLNEYVEDPGGKLTKTEHLYVVDVYTGKPNRLVYNENGEMALISLVD